MNQITDEGGRLEQHRPRNKATMDQPQEEFIAAESAHFEHDQEHGDELLHASHRSFWSGGFAAEETTEGAVAN